jgi:ABC-type multidrug transport system ATPase subunit
MNHGQVAAMGTSDEIIAEHGSGERLEIHGSEKLAAYVEANTDLKIEYDGKGLISIALNQKTDAIAALVAVEQSGLDWGDIQTRRDSLDDVFIKLVRGSINEHGEITAAPGNNNSSGQRRR